MLLGNSTNTSAVTIKESLKCMTNYFVIKVFLHNKFAWLEFLEFLLRHQSNFEKKILSLNFYSRFFLPIIFHLFDIVICTRTYHKRSFFCLILNDNPMCVYFYVCVSVCVCVCVCVCLRPSTVKASSAWAWNTRRKIINVVLRTFLSSAKSLHC